MPRGIVWLIVLLVLLVGAAWFLQSRATERPLTTMESDVTANAA